MGSCPIVGFFDGLLTCPAYIPAANKPSPFRSQIFCFPTCFPFIFPSKKVDASLTRPSASDSYPCDVRWTVKVRRTSSCSMLIDIVLKQSSKDVLDSYWSWCIVEWLEGTVSWDGYFLEPERFSHWLQWNEPCRRLSGWNLQVSGRLPVCTVFSGSKSPPRVSEKGY